MTTLQTNPGFGMSRQLLRSTVFVTTSLVLAATALLAGCASAPEKSEPMIDKRANFDDFKTFGWLPYATTDDYDQPVSLMDTNIRAAITTEMRRKGYVEAPEGSAADLLFDYEAARTEKVKNSPFRIGIGVGSFGSRGGGSVSASTPSVKNVIEGSLVIHAVDAARDAEVWRSRVSRELGKGAVSPEVIQSVVAEVLSDFPARTSTH